MRKQVGECTIGLDIGTTYIKTVATNAKGIRISESQIRTPVHQSSTIINKMLAPNLFLTIREILGTTLAQCRSRGCPGKAVCLTGISPVMVAFDRDQPENSLAVPYWHVPSIDEETIGLERTSRRLDVLTSEASRQGLRNVGITDLLGYLVYRFTGRLCLNTLSIGELGFSSEEKYLRSPFKAANIVLPGEICGVSSPVYFGEQEKVVFCGGASDSITAAVAAGATSKGALMIYLGTFGSLMRVNDDLLPLISAQGKLPKTPYSWIVSVPGFGREIERVACSVCPDAGEQQKLQCMDGLAEKGTSGAKGLILRLPSWDRLGNTVGEFGFVQPRDSEKFGHAEIARAALEALGHRIMVSHSEEVSNATVLYVSGGGSRSLEWCQIISNVLGRPIVSASGGKDGAYICASIGKIALGAADSIAIPSAEHRRIFPNDREHSLCRDTTQIAKTHYHNALGPLLS